MGAWVGRTRAISGLYFWQSRRRGACCDICDICSVCEQSGRTTGRLGSTGLRAMISEGRRSRHSGAYLPQLPQPGLDTISDDYEPAASCRRMALAAATGARATRMKLADEGRSDTVLWDRRLRDRRERADA